MDQATFKTVFLNVKKGQTDRVEFTRDLRDQIAYRLA
jgi:hypothetical protein